MTGWVSGPVTLAKNSRIRGIYSPRNMKGGGEKRPPPQLGVSWGEEEDLSD